MRSNSLPCRMMILKTLSLHAALCVIGWAGSSSAQVFPIAGSGYNEIMVVPAGQSFPGPITATMDGGTSLAGNTWYQVGQNTGATSTGLPMGQLFTVGSPTTGADTFQFQSAGTNDTILLAGDGNGPTTATFTLSQPAAYNNFSFLASNGNGSGNIGVTFNYVGGGTYSTTVNVNDWFSDGSNSAYDANGRINSNGYDQVNTGNPRLYYYDLTGLPSAQQLQSISFNFQGGGNTHTAIMGVSGAYAVPITWSAAQNISGGSDVATLGNSVYAYNWSGSSGTVNGVTFTGESSTSGGSANITNGFASYNGGYTGNAGNPPSSYNGILNGGVYTDGGNPGPCLSIILPPGISTSCSTGQMTRGLVAATAPRRFRASAAAIPSPSLRIPRAPAIPATVSMPPAILRQHPTRRASSLRPWRAVSTRS